VKEFNQISNDKEEKIKASARQSSLQKIISGVYLIRTSNIMVLFQI